MSATSLSERITYPESDGKPMGETDQHVNEIADLLKMLKHYFKDRDAYVGANMLCYYEQGEPSSCYCPDVFVVFNTHKTPRRTWKVWEEGKAQDVIFEITSKKSRLEDQGTKRVLYASLGVSEYFLFDPLQEYLKPPLQGFMLQGENYVPIEPENDGSIQSRLLGLKIKVEEGVLRLFDLSGQKLLRPEEIAVQQEEMAKELKRLRDEVDRLKKRSE
ncbi:MAG TPA: Uma2 family endonuclease [Planctomycetota bacterium]|nr:Uma2 family endonuclease [Planctomycetota bacterium]